MAELNAAFQSSFPALNSRPGADYDALERGPAPNAIALEVMAPGALDPLTEELLYLAVSVTNGCEYCIASHAASARAKGMTDALWAELLAVVGMANETNRLADGWGVPVDEAFRRGGRR
jgi:AhpD family alkylhydroperoxidase